LLNANEYDNVKLFPNAVGIGYVCDPTKTKKTIKNGKMYITLENPRIVKFGLGKGTLDTVGWKIESINGYMIPRFLMIDAKTDKYSKCSDGQNDCINIVIDAGGIAGTIIDPVRELDKLLRTPLKHVSL